MILGMGSQLTVREASAADAPTLARLNAVVQRLHHDAYPHRFHEPDEMRVEPFYRELLEVKAGSMGRRARSWLCVDASDDAMGYVLALVRDRADNPFTRAQRCIELDQIAIVDEERGVGTGRLLASAVIEWARELGVEEVELSVWDFNEGAQAFFAALGAEPLWHRRSVRLDRM